MVDSNVVEEASDMEAVLLVADHYIHTVQYKNENLMATLRPSKESAFGWVEKLVSILHLTLILYEKIISTIQIKIASIYLSVIVFIMFSVAPLHDDAVGEVRPLASGLGLGLHGGQPGRALAVLPLLERKRHLPQGKLVPQAGGHHRGISVCRFDFDWISSCFTLCWDSTGSGCVHI